MDLLRYLFLACLQGITEFLPISSSGHLVFFQKIIGFKEPLLGFDIILHLATVLSIVVFLRKDLQRIFKEGILAFRHIVKGNSLKEAWDRFEYFRILIFVCIAIMPAILVGLLFHSVIEKMFGSLKIVSLSFFITGTVLFLTKNKPTVNKARKLNLIDSFIIGVAQAIAIIPGISRSGMTISSGIFRGLNKELSARFSFLLAIPTISAAAIYKLKDGLGEISVGNLALILSFMTAFLSGYLSLVILSTMIAKAKFHYFSYYCWMMGFVCLIVLIKNG